MTDMPKTIWAHVGGRRTAYPAGQPRRIGGWDESPQDRYTEYRRADLVQPLLEAATALRDHLARWVDGGPIATAEESEAMFTALHQAILAAGGRDIE